MDWSGPVRRSGVQRFYFLGRRAGAGEWGRDSGHEQVADPHPTNREFARPTVYHGHGHRVRLRGLRGCAGAAFRSRTYRNTARTPLPSTYSLCCSNCVFRSASMPRRCEPASGPGFPTSRCERHRFSSLPARRWESSVSGGSASAWGNLPRRSGCQSWPIVLRDAHPRTADRSIGAS